MKDWARRLRLSAKFAKRGEEGPKKPDEWQIMGGVDAGDVDLMMTMTMVMMMMMIEHKRSEGREQSRELTAELL